jgi:branched-chain amino acid transport system substrate-binding protein
VADPIRIGVTLPKTGRYARNAGVVYDQTYRLWVDQVNGRGGILGRPVELVVYDDASDPALAAGLYEQLLFEDRVDLILGPCHSDMTEAIAPLIEREGRVLLQGSGSSHLIFEQGRRYVFLCWSGCDFDYPRSILEWSQTLPTERRPKRAALISMEGRIGSAVALGARHYAAKHRVEIVFDEVMGTPPVDYDGVFARARATRPDLVLVGLDHARPDDPLGSSVGAYRKAGFGDAVFWLSDNPSSHDPVDLLDRAFMRTTWVPNSPIPTSRALVRDYRNAHSRDPEYHHAGGYAVCQVLEQAVEAIGGTDQELLREYLLSGEFDTVMGRIRFKPDGLPDVTMQLSQWVDGELRVVYPAAEQTAPPVLPG